MRFSSAALTYWCMTAGSVGTVAFTWGTSSAVRSLVKPATFITQSISHPAGCSCPSCVTSKHPLNCPCPSCLLSATALHPMSCTCLGCGRRRKATFLFADVSTSTETSPAEIPQSVEDLDGIASPEEAHNAERPARKALTKRGPRPPRGKPLSEFQVGDTVAGKVKKIADYGAFVDFGGATDGLLHISQLSEAFVNSVKDILEEGQEIQVRIVSIDANRNQVGLSMMSLEQQERAQEAATARREQREAKDDQQTPRGDRQQKPQRQQQARTGGPPRRDDSAVLQVLSEKGWDISQFVDGTVVSTTDFGAFVRFDVSALNAEAQGEVDGLVHISALNTGRVQSVKSVVNVDDKVKIRLKSITGNKVSLTMISPEEEQAKAESSGGGSTSATASVGAKDWQESVDRINNNLPTFVNRPQIVDLRNGVISNGFTASAVEVPEVAKTYANLLEINDLATAVETAPTAAVAEPEVVPLVAVTEVESEPEVAIEPEAVAVVADPELTVPEVVESTIEAASVIETEPAAAVEEPEVVEVLTDPEVVESELEVVNEPEAVAGVAEPELTVPEVGESTNEAASVVETEPAAAAEPDVVAVVAEPEVVVSEPEVVNEPEAAAVVADPELTVAEGENKIDASSEPPQES